jgi:UDP-N-acetylglucosamine acyltransferase
MSISMTTLIHPTAVIHPGATLHPTVKVGPYAVIGEKVTVGAETDIGSHVILSGYTEIGERNRIFAGAAIGLEPQDLKYDGSMSLVSIGDDNVIREYVTINRPTKFGEVTKLGNRNLLMAYSHMAHNCIVEDNVIIANSVALAGHVYIESNVRLSGMVGVHQFVHVGCYAMVAGVTRIIRDVPPYMMAEGNPPTVRGLNQVGLQRAGIADLDNGRVYKELKQAYRLLYRSTSTFEQALNELSTWQNNDCVSQLYQFLVASRSGERRGSLPGRKRTTSSSD